VTRNPRIDLRLCHLQSSRERLSPYRDATTPVMNTVPSVMISARVRVMVAISLGLPVE
jgi:hypothetical protein